MLFFKETKNNFIYDFKFEENKGYYGNTPPPPYIKYPKSAQIKIFNEVLKKLGVKQGEPLYVDLIMDSQCLLVGQKYNIDLFLEIMKSCYTQKQVKTLLMMFKLERVQLPNGYKIDPKEYSNFLKLIEKKPNIIIKHCSDKDKPEKYFKLFYSLLLYFRVNFESNKVQELLFNKELYKYFIEILPSNFKAFPNLEIPQELINQITMQKNLKFSIIEGTLFYLKSFEKILNYINENIDLIYEICIKENKLIKVNDLTGPQSDDDISKIQIEIEKLINYELQKGKIFIILNE